MIKRTTGIAFTSFMFLCMISIDFIISPSSDAMQMLPLDVKVGKKLAENIDS